MLKSQQYQLLAAELTRDATAEAYLNRLALMISTMDYWLFRLSCVLISIESLEVISNLTGYLRLRISLNHWSFFSPTSFQTAYKVCALINFSSATIFCLKVPISNVHFNSSSSYCLVRELGWSLFSSAFVKRYCAFWNFP